MATCLQRNHFLKRMISFPGASFLTQGEAKDEEDLLKTLIVSICPWKWQEGCFLGPLMTLIPSNSHGVTVNLSKQWKERRVGIHQVGGLTLMKEGQCDRGRSRMTGPWTEVTWAVGIRDEVRGWGKKLLVVLRIWLGITVLIAAGSCIKFLITPGTLYTLSSICWEGKWS